MIRQNPRDWHETQRTCFGGPPNPRDWAEIQRSCRATPPQSKEERLGHLTDTILYICIMVVGIIMLVLGISLPTWLFNPGSPTP